jgi:clan AA aspartic protease
MATWIGRFDSRGNPILNISVDGLSSQPKSLEALIDTGFTGFLTLPISAVHVREFQLGELQGIKLADGISRMRLTAIVTVSVGNEQLTVEAVLDPDGEEVIIGMDFLRRFARGLIILPLEDKVLLPKDAPAL